MNRFTQTLIRSVAGAALFSFSYLGFAADAQASRGLVVVNTGDDIMQVAEIPADKQPDPANPVKVGVKYSRFGVFWLDIARWNPELCYYTQETSVLGDFSYQPESAETIAAETGLSLAQLGYPVSYYVPPGGAGLALVVALGLPAWMVSSSRRKSKIAALSADPRYQQARAIFAQDAALPQQQRLELAVAYLISQGITRAQALENMALLEDLEEDS